MDKQAHSEALRRVIAMRGLSRLSVAGATGVKERTVTNWTTGATMPSEREREALRRLLGPYDSQGDPVELAIKSSGLANFRQTRVLSVYQEQVHEQRREDAG